MAMETKSEGDKLATCSACNLLFRSWAYLGLRSPGDALYGLWDARSCPVFFSGQDKRALLDKKGK